MSNDTDFASWLDGILVEKNISPAELARRAKVDKGVISRVLNRERKPSTKTVKAIAAALRLSPDVVFRKAGLLPPAPPETEYLDDMNNIANSLNEEKFKIWLRYGRFLMDEQDDESKKHQGLERDLDALKGKR